MYCSTSIFTRMHSQNRQSFLWGAMKTISLWSSIGTTFIPCKGKNFTTISDNTISKFSIRSDIKSVPDLISFADKIIYGDSAKFGFKDEKDVYQKRMPTIPPQMRYWFRGHARTDWNLVPTVHRYNESDSKGFLEKALIRSFQLNHPEHSLDGSSLLDILSTMQHYQYPTRLLDWTSNIAFAAFFSCDNPKHDDSDGLIWILDPFALNLASSLTKRAIGIALRDYFDVRIRSYQAITETYDELLEYGHAMYQSLERPENFIELKAVLAFLEKCYKDETLKEKLQLPIAVDPGAINPRIGAQRGKFTVGSGKQYFSRKTATIHQDFLMHPSH